MTPFWSAKVGMPRDVLAENEIWIGHTWIAP
jgi:hypothetical protein